MNKYHKTSTDTQHHDSHPGADGDKILNQVQDDNGSTDDQAMEQLQHELEQAKKSQEESLAQTQRTLADYSNLKKRFEREREELGKFAAEMTLMQLLPAIDNLERAVNYAPESEQSSSLFQGVKMTLQQLDATLADVGLQRLNTHPGDTFDPHQHDAIDSIAGPKDQIIEVLSAGYQLHDKVIRPARVKVGNGKVDNGQ
jgi:molecular chaperone GrpE